MLQACQWSGESFLMETKAAVSWTLHAKTSSRCTRASRPNFRSTGSQSGQGLLSESASKIYPFHLSETTNCPLQGSSIPSNMLSSCHDLRCKVHKHTVWVDVSAVLPHEQNTPGVAQLCSYMFPFLVIAASLTSAHAAHISPMPNCFLDLSSYSA